MVSQYRKEGKTSPKISNPTPIYANERVIGQVIGDTFRKQIRNNHMLNKPPALAFDRTVLRDAAEAGAMRVEVHNSDTHTTYRATLEAVYAHGFGFDRGHNPQFALGLDWWSIDGATPKAEARAAVTSQQRTQLQMSLFGEGE